MNEKSDKKSSIKVPGDQLPDLKRKLRVNDVLDLGRIATLLFNELKELGSDRWTFGIVVYNSDNADTEYWLSLPHVGLLPRFTGSSRHDNFSHATDRAWKSKRKIFQQINAESHIQPSKPLYT